MNNHKSSDWAKRIHNQKNTNEDYNTEFSDDLLLRPETISEIPLSSTNKETVFPKPDEKEIIEQHIKTKKQ